MARKPADQSVSREDILLAAADVLQRNGYESTTMKDIAAAVNLTAASLYHHFRNKDALLLAVLEAGLDQVLSQIEPIAHSELSSADKLRQIQLNSQWRFVGRNNFLPNLFSKAIGEKDRLVLPRQYVGRIVNPHHRNQDMPLSLLRLAVIALHDIPEFLAGGNLVPENFGFRSRNVRVGSVWLHGESEVRW